MERFMIDAVKDDSGTVWVYGYNCMCTLFTNIRCDSLDDGIEKLKEHGLIKQDPLEKALEAVDKSKTYIYSEQMGGDIMMNIAHVEKIIRTLHKELTE